MPPWPAWDLLPSGQRGDTLALQHWGLAVRRKSHRPLPVPGKGLLRPGLPSGAVPAASVPATATSLVLLSSQPRRWEAGASWGGESSAPFFLVGCSALSLGDWRVDSSFGAGEALLRWVSMRGSGLETSCCLSFGRVLRWSLPVVIVSPVLHGLEVGEGSRIWFSESYSERLFCLSPKHAPRYGCGPYPSFGGVYKGELKIKIFSSLCPSKNDSALRYVLFGFFLLCGFWILNESALGVS